MNTYRTSWNTIISRTANISFGSHGTCVAWKSSQAPRSCNNAMMPHHYIYNKKRQKCVKLELLLVSLLALLSQHLRLQHITESERSQNSRDLWSFEIRFEFESNVPIRFDSKVMDRFENFESLHLPRLPSYHKQHSLFNDKFQSFRHCYWDLYWV